MNSLSRMLEVLKLFSADQPVIDIEIICSQLGYTSPSAYRYVRELSNAGLLVRLPRGYALGPRIIELDRHMTQFDPLLAASHEYLHRLLLIFRGGESGAGLSARPGCHREMPACARVSGSRRTPWEGLLR